MSAPAPASRAEPGVRTLESFVRLPVGPRTHAVLRFFYYLAIIVALLWIYGRGDFVTAPFVYQGF